MSAMPEREVEARVEWFLTTGDVRQWSGPDEQNPFPLMQEDFAAYLASAESRLLAAEARVREVEAKMEVLKQDEPRLRRLLAETQHYRDVLRSRDGATILDFYDVWLNQARAETTKVRAERDALVPLARFGMASLDDNTENYGPSAELDYAASFGVFTRITHNDGGVSWDDTPATTQARAILAREGA